MRLLAARHAEVLRARSFDTTERLLAITGALADAVTSNEVELIGTFKRPDSPAKP